MKFPSARMIITGVIISFLAIYIANKSETVKRILNT